MAQQQELPLTMYTPPPRLFCQRPRSQIEDMREALHLTQLDPPQKKFLELRFLFLLRQYKRRANRYSLTFHTLRTLITVGSLVVPAILSIQYTTTPTESSAIDLGTQAYWIVWTLSLLVTISNGIMTLLKVDKKYFMLNTTYQHLLSEGWQFIALSGHYSGFNTPAETPSHKNQYQFFCHALEKVRMKQVEEEYYKVADSLSNPSSSSNSNDSLVPPTPQRTNSQGKVNEATTGKHTTVRRHPQTGLSTPSAPPPPSQAAAPPNTRQSLTTVEEIDSASFV